MLASVLDAVWAGFPVCWRAKGRATRLIVVELLLALVATRYLKSVDYRTVRRNHLLEKTIADTMSF